MRSHALPLLDLWFDANVKANVLTFASYVKRKTFMYCLLPYWVRAAPMYKFRVSAGRRLSSGLMEEAAD